LDEVPVEPATGSAATEAGLGPALVPLVAAEPDPGIPVSGRFDLDITGEGTVDAPSASGTVAFREVRYDEYAVGSGSADITLADGVATVRAALPEYAVDLDGTVGLDEPRPVAVQIRADGL